MDFMRSQHILGLSSSSSLEGISAALIDTDGIDIFSRDLAREIPYDDDLQEQLYNIHHNIGIFDDSLRLQLGQTFTRFIASIVSDIKAEVEMPIDLIGFSGHTIKHNPEAKIIEELGDGQLLADLSGIETVSRFPQADILAGGQGAPLSAIYHQAITYNLPKPIAVVDISGISSLSWFGSNGEVMAFDIGPGISAINKWVFKHGGQSQDYNGKLAALGQVSMPIINQLMRHKYLAKMPPKAADKDTFNNKLEHLEGLSLTDGAATVTSFIAEAIAYSMALYLPEMPQILLVCGSGASNPSLLRFLRQRFDNTEIKIVEDYGLNSGAIEAEAYAFLAARRYRYMPSSYPFTTGVGEPCILGELFVPTAK